MEEKPKKRRGGKPIARLLRGDPNVEIPLKKTKDVVAFLGKAA